MAYSARTEAFPQEHPAAWTVGKLILSAVVTGAIIMAFVGASFMLGTKPPQQPSPPSPTQKFQP